MNFADRLRAIFASDDPESDALWAELEDKPKSFSMDSEGYMTQAEVLQAMAGDTEWDMGDGWGIEKDEIRRFVQALPNSRWFVRSWSGGYFSVKGALVSKEDRGEVAKELAGMAEAVYYVDEHGEAADKDTAWGYDLVFD